MAVKPVRPVILTILDGWGIAPPSRGNAISLAKTPFYDGLLEKYPTIALQSAGEGVGSTWGELGNSEVGHLNIGAGRIVYQDLPRITKAIADGEFFKNPVLVKAAAYAREHKSRFHIMGLMSSGGVHSFNEHAYALLEFAKRENLSSVFVHAFLDGRDTPHNSSERFINKLQEKIKQIGVGQIASLSGRFWAMDRDNHWDRIEKAYRAMVEGVADRKSSDPLRAIQESYTQSVFDEEFVPTVITDQAGQPLAKVDDHDVVVFFNFRSDRAREMTKALALPGFEKFKRAYQPELLFVAMTEYEKDLPVVVAFPPERVDEPLAKVLADKNLRQLHIAETEKYAHVTFFFNGGKEEAFANEERILIPSPSVASYDQKPSMSAREITDRVIEQLKTAKHDFIVINYANADMVGHTGKLQSTIEAVEVIDECLSKLVGAVLEVNGVMLLTGDHGNAEDKINLQTGFFQKEHTTNPVPLILIGQDFEKTDGKKSFLRDLSMETPSGLLSDIAPTILELMGVTQPQAMTGQSLLTILNAQCKTQG